MDGGDLVRSITELLGCFVVKELDFELELGLELELELEPLVLSLGREVGVLVKVRGSRLVPQASHKRKVSGLWRVQILQAQPSLEDSLDGSRSAEICGGGGDRGEVTVGLAAGLV